MRLFIGSMILVAAGAAAYGQTAVTPALPPMPAVPADAKVIAELATAVSQLGGVKNSPFSAEEVNESVQTLADGNRIVHNSTNKVYRNGEGRMRRDIQGGAMGGVL